jgi:O-antigen ligase
VGIAGAVEAIFAILQHIPRLGFPNAYKDLPTLAYDNVYLSSGLTDSPIFYGAFVTLIFGICAGAAIFLPGYDLSGGGVAAGGKRARGGAATSGAKRGGKLGGKSRIYTNGLFFEGGRYFPDKRRLFFLAVALVSFTTGLFTSSITPVIGCAAAVVVMFICAVYYGESRYVKSVLQILAVMAVIFLVVLAFQGLWFRDTYIARFDGFFRKMIVGSTVNDSRNLYTSAWSASLAAIKAHPLFGVGPDGFAAWQNFTPMTYDKSYNEYLFVAVTRGIPSALIFIAFIVYSARRLIKDFKNPFSVVCLIALVAYAVQAFFNASAVTVAPLFWAAAASRCTDAAGQGLTATSQITPAGIPVNKSPHKSRK